MCVHSVGKILPPLSERGKSTENKSWFAPRGLAKWTKSLDYTRKRWGESERDKERRWEHDREKKKKGKKERKGMETKK